ncbi:MAG: hypothetical protein NEHIOOID_00579 [Holosporales bacterium]
MNSPLKKKSALIAFALLQTQIYAAEQNATQAEDLLAVHSVPIRKLAPTMRMNINEAFSMLSHLSQDPYISPCPSF